LWAAIAALAVVVLCSGVVVALALASRQESSYRAVIRRAGWNPAVPGDFEVEFDLSLRNGGRLTHLPGVRAFEARTGRSLPGAAFFIEAYSPLSSPDGSGRVQRLVYSTRLAQPVVGPLHARLKVQEPRPPAWWQRLLPPVPSAEPPWLDVLDSEFTLPPMPAPPQAPTSKP
jgi:hypothetical protein